MSDQAAERTRLTALLTGLGVKVESGPAEEVRIRVGGVYATILFYGDGTLSLLCAVDGAGVNLRLDDINAANNRVRFAKFSVRDHALLLEADFVFTMGAPDAGEKLSHVLDVWKLALLELKHLVEGLLAAA